MDLDFEACRRAFVTRDPRFDGRIFGPIDKDLVVGRAIARIWPLSRLGGL